VPLCYWLHHTWPETHVTSIPAIVLDVIGPCREGIHRTVDKLRQSFLDKKKIEMLSTL
jgi:hypothetical protein